MFKGKYLDRRVRSKATGANVHKINNSLMVYLGYLKELEDDTIDEEDALILKKTVERYEDVFNKFIITGILDPEELTGVRGQV